MGRTGPAAVLRGAGVVALALLVSSCSDDVARAAAWAEPESYSYVLESACGDWPLEGTFRVVVRNGMTIDVDARDDLAEASLASSPDMPVPTLAELVDEALLAERDGAERVDVEVTWTGRPTAVDIDWARDEVADESCYRVLAYAEGDAD